MEISARRSGFSRGSRQRLVIILSEDDDRLIVRSRMRPVDFEARRGSCLKGSVQPTSSYWPVEVVVGPLVVGSLVVRRPEGDVGVVVVIVRATVDRSKIANGVVGIVKPEEGMLDKSLT